MKPTRENPFLRFWNAGYKTLVPITPPDAKPSPRSTFARRPKALGKAPGIKGDDGLWRGFDWIPHTATAEDLAVWHFMGAGVGIKTGAGLVAVDIDTLNPDLVEKICASANRHLGNAPVRVGRAPKLLLLYAVSARRDDGSHQSVPYRKVLFEDGTPTAPGAEPRVELLTEGRQFVAQGIHPTTRQPYEWPAGIWPVADLVRVTQAQLDAFFDELARTLPGAKAEADAHGQLSDRTAINQDALKGRLDDVKRAVSALPNTTAAYPSYDSYIRIGYAIKAATQDDPATGLELFQAWAAKWEGGNEPEVVEADWRRMRPPYSIGAQYLYAEAERHSPAQFDRVSTLLEPVEETGDEPAAPTKPTKTYTLLGIRARAALALQSGTAPLIKGLLDQGAMTVLYGESNVGKTFVALDLAFHIAAGLAYAGLKTTQADVVYVVAEGGRGVSKRIAALAAKHPNHADAPLYTLASPVDLLRPDADLVPLAKTLRELTPRPGLIVLDTLSRVLAGGDENSSTDMGALVKHFDLLRAATGAHLMAIHHTGKDKARGARGHSLLRAATDTEIEVADGVITVTKQRDIESSWSSGFGLESVVLGIDAEGDPVKSATVKLGESAAATAEQGVATQKEGVVLEAIAAVAADNLGGTGVVKTSQVLLVLKDMLSREVTKQELQGLLHNLHKKNLVKRPVTGFVERVDIHNTCDLFD